MTLRLYYYRGRSLTAPTTFYGKVEPAVVYGQGQLKTFPLLLQVLKWAYDDNNHVIYSRLEWNSYIHLCTG